MIFDSSNTEGLQKALILVAAAKTPWLQLHRLHHPSPFLSRQYKMYLYRSFHFKCHHEAALGRG